MAAYLIGKTEISDPSWLPEYTEKVQKMYDEIGVWYHVRSNNIEKLEGKSPVPTAMLVIEFPSMEVAREWYNSEEYQELVELRNQGSQTELWLTEGV